MKRSVSVFVCYTYGVLNIVVLSFVDAPQGLLILFIEYGNKRNLIELIDFPFATKDQIHKNVSDFP